MQLPAIRQLILPDKDHIIFDCDMSGADAQVVAWEANDADLKAAFRGGLKVHIKNFEDFYQKPFKPEYKYQIQPGRIYAPYDEMKRAVHATNYAASPRTVAGTLQWKISEAENFQRRWFKLHPGIKEWHRRCEKNLQLRRTVENAFGYRITYFGRVAEVLPKALAWIPQSTVGLLAAKAAIALDDAYGYGSTYGTPLVRILLQVHDSLVFEVRKDDITADLLAGIKSLLHQPVPYPDTLNIGWSVAASTKSWGHCKEMKWDTLYEDIQGG